MAETPTTLAQSEMQEVLGLASANNSQPARKGPDTDTADLAEQEGRKPKYHHGSGKGQPIQSWANRQGSNSSQSQWRMWQNSKQTWSNKNQDEDRVEELSNIVRLLAKVVLRHEEEHSRLRVETGFLVYCDTGEHGVTSTLFKMAQAWKAKKEEGTVSTSLRVTLFLEILQILQDKLGELLANEDQLKAAEKHEWLMIGDKPLDPSCYHTWSPTEKTSVRSKKDARTHGQILKILGVLQRTISEEHVLTRFHATRPLTERLEGPVLPFLLSVGVRSDRANEAHDALMSLVDSAALKLVGIRWRPERLERQPIVKVLEQSFKESSICDWGQSCGSRAPQARDSEMKDSQFTHGVPILIISDCQ